MPPHPTAFGNTLLKHPSFRVGAWRWVSQGYRKLVGEAVIQRGLPTLPFRPVRVELVGSMVRGCGQLGSDLDLNLAARDWNEQVEWRRIWAVPEHRQRFVAALQDVLGALGLSIDVSPNNPDQFSYDHTYDFLTDSFTRADRPFPDLTSRAWDGYQCRWVPVPLTYKATAFEADRWAHDVPQWEAEYGERFLPFRPQLSGANGTAADAQPAARVPAFLPAN